MDVVVMVFAHRCEVLQPGDLRQPPRDDVVGTGPRVGLIASVDGAPAPLRLECPASASGGVAMSPAGTDRLAGGVEDDGGDPAGAAQPVNGLEPQARAVGHPR